MAACMSMHTSKEPCSLRALMKTGSRAGDSFWALSTTTTPPGQSLRKPESSFCTAPAASGLLCADCPACMMGDELNSSVLSVWTSEQQSTALRAWYTSHDGARLHLECKEAAATAGWKRLLDCQCGGRRSSLSASHHQHSHALSQHPIHYILCFLAEDSLPFCKAFKP